MFGRPRQQVHNQSYSTAHRFDTITNSHSRSTTTTKHTMKFYTLAAVGLAAVVVAQE